EPPRHARQPTSTMWMRAVRTARRCASSTRQGATMHTTFFTGRLLSADDFQAEQSYLRPPHAQAHARSGSGSLLDRIALNPQPLPPKSAVEQLVSSLPPSLLDTVALNPQPLPPKAFDAVALNPQPLPPKHFDTVALNPQPLPPRESLGDAAEIDMMQ